MNDHRAGLDLIWHSASLLAWYQDLQMRASISCFRNLDRFADRLSHAGLRHLPRNIGEGRSGMSILLCQLLGHDLIMSPVERQERSIRTSILRSALLREPVHTSNGRKKSPIRIGRGKEPRSAVTTTVLET